MEFPSSTLLLSIVVPPLWTLSSQLAEIPLLAQPINWKHFILAHCLMFRWKTTLVTLLPTVTEDLFAEQPVSKLLRGTQAVIKMSCTHSPGPWNPRRKHLIMGQWLLYQQKRQNPGSLPWNNLWGLHTSNINIYFSTDWTLFSISCDWYTILILRDRESFFLSG